MTRAADAARPFDAGATALRAAGVSESRTEDLRSRLGRSLTTARAMSFAAAFERMKQRGFSDQEAGQLLTELAPADLAAPLDHADAVAALVRRLEGLGIARRRAVEAALRVASDATAAILARAAQDEPALRAWAAIAAEGRGRPETPEARPERNTAKGGSTMADLEKHSDSAGNHERERDRERLAREREALDREREKMEHERERTEREREKLDREREKLDRLQEALEERLEQQEERLQELEEELEERMEAIEDAADELDDIEVEGIDGVREMLDVVSERLPHLMRGMHDSVYSPEKLRATAESFAAFYTTLKEAGMPDDLAAQMTRDHFAKLDRQLRAKMEPRRAGRHGHAAPPGPDFDPLGPNFDPLGPKWSPFGTCCEPAESPAAPEPPEPAEPAP